MATILVIEDEEIILDNLLEILELEGFSTIGAEHGAIGLQKAKSYLPDLILCDICMPELDGYGVLEALRRDPETATIPLIFLSAKGEHAEIRQGMNLGADDYLTKPCAISDLLEAVSSRLKKHATLNQVYIQQHLSQDPPGSTHLDPLTHLLDRTLLSQHLQQAISQNQPGIAALCLNVNRFRTINTTFGHSVGDLLLQAIAQRLQDTLQFGGTIARLGADEFGVVLAGLSEQDVAQVAQRILIAATAPYCIDGYTLHIQVSLGIAVHSALSHSSERLLVQAETARRWCQKQGQSHYLFYSLTMDTLEVERGLIESDLGKAVVEQAGNPLKQPQFQLHYQPQVNLATGQIVGVEALLRWQHPQRGMIPPKMFIPIAEELGLIVPIGEWVLRTACNQAKRWQTLSLVPLRVSVNLSMRQFRQENLAEMVGQILAETGLEPQLLVLELTETSVMQDVSATVRILRQLKRLGVEISLDDFGTGYSSLNYLNYLPIDALKIDQSFVRQGAINSSAAAISTAIITMARSLKLKVVAEGVETQNQLAFLREIGCQSIQGFLYSPPLPPEEVQPLLSADRRLQIVGTQPEVIPIG
jgi:diguanylate cyclase